jgi:carbon-monoxide dehydrogenase large subunit
VVERYEGLLSGDAHYTGDLAVDDALHAAFVRSTVAHARIGAIDIDAAASTPGVVAVLTAADLSFVPVPPYVGRAEMAERPLARDVVRHAGERLAIVVATSRVAAEDATELVVVDYEPLPAVNDPLAAAASDSPLIFPDHGTNVLLDLPADVPAPTIDGDVTIRLATAVPRLAVAPMEGHAVVVVPAGDRLDVWCSTQAAHLARLRLAASLGWAPERIRVRVPRVGGGFGGKAAGLPTEHVVVAAAAVALGRPVRYEEDRASNLVGMQGRGVHQDLELHARRDGTLVGMRLAVTCDSGGYPGIAAIEPMKMKLMASGPYRIPAVEFTARAVFTNRTPTTAYRGPGRSEAAIVLERGLDVLAAELDIDPVELRRRNLLRPDEFPYRTPTGMTYDSGDYGCWSPKPTTPGCGPSRSGAAPVAAPSSALAWPRSSTRRRGRRGPRGRGCTWRPTAPWSSPWRRPRPARSTAWRWRRWWPRCCRSNRSTSSWWRATPTSSTPAAAPAAPVRSSWPAWPSTAPPPTWPPPPGA